MTDAPPQTQGNLLVKALAEALPKDSRYVIRHLSTTPALTDALYYPPALNSTGERRPGKPLKTYCEKHFLTVSITDPTTDQDVLVLALEVYIYTTNISTTIFIAKADSTGYLHLQSTPKGFSPIRAVTAAFVKFLVQHRRRPSKQLVVNLFARAQSQYIFPGSVDNNKKHILDDRGLIKWWCRVLDPLLEDHLRDRSTSSWEDVHGYLVIPGLDTYETRAFVPKTEHAAHGWTLGHPLELISPYKRDTTSYGTIPPRCLIPTYPDDPKARFIDELEESTSEKAKLIAGWKTPKTLEQFWEMMAFRQECSSGRITGFVWLVFEPGKVESSSVSTHLPVRSSHITNPNSTSAVPIPAALVTSKPVSAGLTPPSTESHEPVSTAASAKPTRRKRRGRIVLKGPIIPRKPRVKTNRVKFPDRIHTPHYYWPEAGRGKVVLDEAGYKRAVELLLHLEFKSLDQAIASTRRWADEVNVGENWAFSVVGEKHIPDQSESRRLSTVVNDMSNSVLKKRKVEDEDVKKEMPAAVNMLAGGLVRKRVKP